MPSTSPIKQMTHSLTTAVALCSCLLSSWQLQPVKAYPTLVSSAENEVTAPEESNNGGGGGGGSALMAGNDVFIHPLSGDFQKAFGVLATITNSIEDQIRMPDPLTAEAAIFRMQQVRPIIDEAFHRFSKDLEKWSRQHPAESRQLFTIILPAVGIAVLAVALMSVLVVGFSYVMSAFGAGSVAGLLSGLLAAGRTLPFPGAEGLLNLTPDMYNVSFWQGLDSNPAVNPNVLKSVFEAIDKFNKMQDEKRREISLKSHNAHQSNPVEE